jgi:hypothetical protein
VAEGFTCDVDYLDRFACEGLDFYSEHESKRYCVLHYPGEEKNKEDFLKVKKSKLDRQDYIFRGTVFPKGTSDPGRGAIRISRCRDTQPQSVAMGARRAPPTTGLCNARRHVAPRPGCPLQHGPA